MNKHSNGNVKVKKPVISFLVVLFVICAVPVCADYSSRAYGGTGDETFMSRTSDWFATLGKTQEEKYRIKTKRRAARKIKKAKKAIEKRKKELAKKRNIYRR